MIRTKFLEECNRILIDNGLKRLLIINQIWTCNIKSMSILLEANFIIWKWEIKGKKFLEEVPVSNKNRQNMIFSIQSKQCIRSLSGAKLNRFSCMKMKLVPVVITNSILTITNSDNINSVSENFLSAVNTILYTMLLSLQSFFENYSPTTKWQYLLLQVQQLLIILTIKWQNNH